LKPSPKIFKFLLDKINTTSEECIFIGDDYDIDIIGAQRVGMDQVFFNSTNQKIHSQKPTFEVKDLSEIKKIL